MEASACACVAGNGVHSSNAMVMVASNWSWMAVDASGVSRWAEPVQVGAEGHPVLVHGAQPCQGT